MPRLRLPQLYIGGGARRQPSRAGLRYAGSSMHAGQPSHNPLARVPWTLVALGIGATAVVLVLAVGYMGWKVGRSQAPSDSVAMQPLRVDTRERTTIDIGDATLTNLKGMTSPWISSARAASAADEFRQAGGDVRQVVFAQLMDEPTGQSLEFIAQDAAYAEAFRAWLKRLEIGRAHV